MKRFVADLHIHTALSPCASEEMTPPAIVRAAVEKGLAMIAICDHNSAANAAAVQRAAGWDLAVVAGMEITTAEEVHVLGLFPDAASARAASRDVLATLPAQTQAGRAFGAQPRMDASGQVVGVEPKMLAAAVALGLSQTVALIKRCHGLAIAAHVDRPSFSVISQLGMFSPDVRFDAAEMSKARPTASPAAKLVPAHLPVITSSDSHFLLDVASACTVLQMQEPTFEELALAFKGAAGRRVCHV